MNKFLKDAARFTAMLMVATAATNIVKQKVPGARNLLG